MLSATYRLLTDLGGPVIYLYLRRRLARGREDADRFFERLGYPSQSRPQGKLIWCHAASVGEAASLLALIEKLRELYPEIQVLITTGTMTSARMLAGRIPKGVIHQYVPVDRAPYVKRFLDYWHPDFALWIESELWPNMLHALRKRMIPAALVNSRMSDKSFRNWYRVKGWAQQMLGCFDIVLAQTEEERSRFVALGAKPVRCVGNLKYAGNPLPFDAQALTKLKDNLAGRPCWLMASTHRGEEEMAIAAHHKLRDQWPDLLTIIVPRHAVRGDEIAATIAGSDMSFARRSKNDLIRPETGIYLADTMNELGLFYRLCPIVVMGGSFAAAGGHNPIEPAQLGAAVIFGPHMHNFAGIAHEFMTQQAAIPLQNANEIAFTINRLLISPEARERYAYAARMLAEDKRHVLDKVLEALKPWLEQKTESGYQESGVSGKVPA